MDKVSKYPSKVLQDAVEVISSFPGIGARSSLRLALHLCRQPSENIHAIADAIDRLATDIRYCRKCNMIADGDLCGICSDNRRDAGTICVVESIRDVMNIEATDQYRGVYHVLGGIISPINGIAPSDLAIDSLVKRAEEIAASGNAGEVILALSGEVEGETTSFYIYRMLQHTGIKVSTLARGLGFSDDLEYADPLTLGRSILNRQIFKP